MSLAVNPQEKFANIVKKKSKDVRKEKKIRKKLKGWGGSRACAEQIPVKHRMHPSPKRRQFSGLDTLGEKRQKEAVPKNDERGAKNGCLDQQQEGKEEGRESIQGERYNLIFGGKQRG